MTEQGQTFDELWGKVKAAEADGLDSELAKIAAAKMAILNGAAPGERPNYGQLRELDRQAIEISERLQKVKSA
jgi:hypothetical protein